MPSLDLSLFGLYSQAAPVVQGVLIALLLCSVLCWAIILEKIAVLVGLRSQTRTFEAAVSGPAVPASIPGPGLARDILSEGTAEWGASKPGESAADRRDRIERAMRAAMLENLIRSESRLHYLATIGSSAPFIGLFGTVWGIMHSFSAIAQLNDTSLAVVAPGIAEALSTTAAGLAAAIPASIAYNKLASDFGGLSRRLGLSIARVVRKLDGARP